MSGLLDSLLKAVDSKATSGLDYVELRADDVAHTLIELRESSTESVSRKSEQGHSARVLVGGRWGFAVSDGLRSPAETIEEASKAARSLPEVTSVHPGLSHPRPVRKEVKIRVRDHLDEIDIADKISYLRAVCRGIVKADTRLMTTKASYIDITGQKGLVTSDGTAVKTGVSHAYLMTTSSGKASGRPVSVRDEIGTVTSGWEHFSDKNNVESVVERQVRKARQQMDGVSCRPGTHPCVISPRVAGMLAHEALGHLSEADYFSSGAFEGFQGKRVAPGFVTMVDSPWIEDGFGNVVVDDEGTVPKTVALIDKGVLDGQLANREWAKRLGIEPTGNARAENYRVPPLIRMRNTYFKQGDKSFEELLEDKKFGYYCVDVRGGQAEANSSFQVGIQECFEIVKGELGRPVRSLAISGLATRALALIDGMGDDFGFESSYCGKMSQSMATSDGGPHVSVKRGGVVFGGSS